MKRIISFFAIAIVLATLFATNSSLSVQTVRAKSCEIYDSRTDGRRIPFVIGHTYTINTYDTRTGELRFSDTIYIKDSRIPRLRPRRGAYNIVIDHDCGALFHDGRLNDDDAGETFAVYCQADGSVRVYAIYKGDGYLAFTASAEEIAKVPNPSAENTLIKEGLGAFLYRLTSGELQVNRAEDGTGKTYSFKFTCP